MPVLNSKSLNVRALTCMQEHQNYRIFISWIVHTYAFLFSPEQWKHCLKLTQLFISLHDNHSFL